jgi:hypothetical protein
VPESFIGTRHANNTRFCMYMMPGRNATSDDSEDPRSCDGILSDECYDAMLNATLRAMPERDNCPPMEGLREHCGFGTHVGRGKYSMIHCIWINLTVLKARRRTSQTLHAQSTVFLVSTCRMGTGPTPVSQALTSFRLILLGTLSRCTTCESVSRSRCSSLMSGRGAKGTWLSCAWRLAM